MKTLDAEQSEPGEEYLIMQAEVGNHNNMKIYG
jgi:hypothetical protein